MSDAALTLLMQAMVNLDGPVLWLADEHVRSEAIPANPGNIRCMTNRIDVARLLEQRGYPVVLSDFEDLQGEAFSAVCYRVSKEKPLVHHLVNAAMQALPVDGQLLLSGFKGDGIKTYVQKAAAMVSGSRDMSKGQGGAQLAVIDKVIEPATLLDDSDYTRLRNIAPAGLPEMFSKPGVFGWKKIDKGSELLIEKLAEFLQGFEQQPETVLDLGCGYGYLSVLAHQQLPCRYLATDNNVAAANACRENFRRHGIEGEVILADCGDEVSESVDAVLCNPPFHQGFDVSSELTDRFLAATHRLLKPGGQALFVVNQFIGLEKRAEGQFAAVQRLADGGGFKLIVLRR